MFSYVRILWNRSGTDIRRGLRLKIFRAIFFIQFWRGWLVSATIGPLQLGSHDKMLRTKFLTKKFARNGKSILKIENC